MLRGFVHAADRPLSRALQAAARALAAGDSNGLVVVTLLLLEGNCACGGTVPGERRVACHSESYSAPHRASTHVALIYAHGALSEVSAARSFGHFASPHWGLLRWFLEFPQECGHSVQLASSELTGWGLFPSLYRGGVCRNRRRFRVDFRCVPLGDRRLGQTQLDSLVLIVRV